MRVLMLADRYPPEARSVAHLFQELAEDLTRAGHQVTVITKMPTESLPSGKPGTKENLGGIEVRRISGLFDAKRSVALRMLDQIYVGLRTLASALWTSRPDVALVYSPPLPLAFACTILRLTRNVPYVVHLHDLYPRTAVELGALRNSMLIGMAKAMESAVYRSACRLVVPNEGERSYLVSEKGLPPDKVELIYNWVDTSMIRSGSVENQFRREKGLAGRFVVLYAGQMGLAQDFSAMIEGAKLLSEQKDILFLMIGDGPLLAEWRTKAKDLDNVMFLPPVDKGEYFASMEAADVGMIALSRTLLSPAVPGKLQNIAGAARPVIALVSSECEAAKVVQEVGCGVVVAPEDGKAMRDAVLKLRHSPSERIRLGSAGRSFALARFSRQQATKRFEKILTDAVTKPAAPSA